MNNPLTPEQLAHRAHVRNNWIIGIIVLLVLGLSTWGINLYATTPHGETIILDNGTKIVKEDKVKLILAEKVDWAREIQSLKATPQNGDQLFMVENCECDTVKAVKTFNKQITIKTNKEKVAYHYNEFTLKNKQWTIPVETFELPENSKVEDYLYTFKK